MSKSKHNSNPTIPYDPFWYDVYMISKRWHAVKLSAYEFFDRHGRLHCQINSSHGAEQYHHASYRNLGTSKEWEDLIPLCQSCHEIIKKCGPRLPKNPPEELVQKLREEGLVIQ